MAKSNEDCYYFYYSNCNKESKCPFRHCEAAKGTEIVCTRWQNGSCVKLNCPFRHAVIGKSRTAMECYWEKQPGGCQKPHCVFKHSKPRHFDGKAAADSTVTEKTEAKAKDGFTITMDAANEAKTVKQIFKRLAPKLTATTDGACVSDSEVSSSKRRRKASITDIIQSVQKCQKSGAEDEKKVDTSSETSNQVVIKQRKICLRKPTLKSDEGSTSDALVKETPDQLPQPKKPRMWRRKSASPVTTTDAAEMKPASEDKKSDTVEQPQPPSSTTAKVEDTQDNHAVSKPLDEGKAEKRTSDIEMEDEQYKAKLIDIFGPSLAEMYLSQGIKLDLSQYPSK